MDVIVSIFQFICLRIYGMPKVKLEYPNGLEKLNCAYCGYFKGLIAYVQEIAARTE